jgi:hypothetical protein
VSRDGGWDNALEYLNTPKLRLANTFFPFENRKILDSSVASRAPFYRELPENRPQITASYSMASSKHQFVTLSFDNFSYQYSKFHHAKHFWLEEETFHA